MAQHAFSFTFTYGSDPSERKYVVWAESENHARRLFLPQNNAERYTIKHIHRLNEKGSPNVSPANTP